MTERINNEDIHTNNVTTFGFKGEKARTTSKIFIYRMIFADAFSERGYGGPAYAYANDPLFMPTSTSIKFWEGTVEKFFKKYEGIENHSIALIRTAIETGRICSPSGRFYSYHPKAKRSGIVDWPRTEILNHIVQGFSADLMILCRLLVSRRLKALNYGNKALLINTVHDDIELDVDNNPEMCYNICILLEQSFKDIPVKFEKDFGSKINVPMAGECKFGMTMHEDSMKKFNPLTFEKDWELAYENSKD